MSWWTELFDELFGPGFCTHKHAIPFRRHGAEGNSGVHLYGWYCTDCKQAVER